MSSNRTDVKTNKLHQILAYGILTILAVMPFHATITVYLASLGFDYDAVRLWKEALLLILTFVALYLVWQNKAFSVWFARDNAVKLIVVFLGLATLSATIVLLTGAVSPRAVGFGLIVDTRMFIMVLVTMIAMHLKLHLAIPRWVIIPAIVVMGFGLMQMAFLPSDVLRHVGYSRDIIEPVQFVDNNPDYPRVQSTLRGPNPLGAYLIPIVALLFIGIKKFPTYKWQFVTAMVAGLTVLFGTYSRSAWIGMAVALGLLVGWQVKARVRRTALTVLVGMLVVLGVGVYALRDNDIVQNVVFHSSEKSPSAISSNEARYNSLESGIKDIASQPLGGGVGSAGPASVHNAAGSMRQSENFYIQIGRELGVIGLALYIAITGVLLHRLYVLRNNTVARAVLAAFIGLILVNMLSHAWSDDTLAYVFGALIGYALTAYKVSTKNE